MKASVLSAKAFRKNFSCLSLIVLLTIQLFAFQAVAQNTSGDKKVKKDETKGTREMEQMLDMSRPNANHELLGQLAGTWNFQDTKLSFVKGTLTRTPIYDGRFFQVQITGGKLPLPIAGGAMKEDNYQSLQIEGYDNPRKKFVMTSINNHIGSDIQLQTGTFNPAKNDFTFEWEDETLPAQKKLNQRVLRIIDANHYVEEFFEIQNGKPTKVRELMYTKTAGN